ncbi:MAG: Hsp20/alpha crystallin family protein [bacterium]
MLVPWHPMQELDRLRQEMNRLFDWSPAWSRGMVSTWQPSLDIYQTDTEVVAMVEIPGVNPEDVDVTVTKNMLSVKGNLKQSDEVKEEGYFRSERRYGAFQRVVPLPAEVKSTETKASFKNGVLEIRMPKAKPLQEESFKPKIEH